MGRKNHKGIVGKQNATHSTRYKTGVGLGFKDDNVSYPEDIEKAIDDKKKK
jgi:hypothetical protein